MMTVSLPSMALPYTNVFRDLRNCMKFCVVEWSDRTRSCVFFSQTLLQSLSDRPGRVHVLRRQKIDPGAGSFEQMRGT